MRQRTRPARRALSGALAAWVLVGGCSEPHEPVRADPAIPVRQLEVLRATALGRDVLAGVLEAEREARLAFGVAGRVASIAVEEGDCVAADQVLASLDREPFQARQREARAALESAELAYRRATALGEIGSQAAIDELRLTRKRLRAVLDQADYALRRSELSAPFGGCIGRRFLELGEAVDERASAFLLVAHRPRIRARVGVPASRIDRIEVGQSVRLSQSRGSGPPATGRVVQRGVLADEVTGTFAVLVEIPNEAGRLLPGMVVDAFFEQSFEDSGDELVSIPISALAGVRADRGFVFVDGGGVARKLELRVEQLYQDRVVVRSALRPGDHVLVSAARPLREGERIVLGSEAGEREAPAQTLGAATVPQPLGSAVTPEPAATR